MGVEDPSALPYPGEELAYRVTGVTGVAGDAIQHWFEASGEQSVRDISAALGLLGRDLRSFRRVLDFGCGPGRVLLRLKDLAEAGVRLHGTDIDQRAIQWARGHIPWARFEVNAPLPPLPYEDAAFDLILNHSVFTHIDEDYQDRWLAELHRITVPGAILLLSVNGEHPFAEFERQTREHGGDPAPVREALDAEGIVFLREDSWLGSAFPDFYHSTFHKPGYVMDHWSWFFDVRGYLPRHALGHQDAVVLERRAGALPAGGPPRYGGERASGVPATVAPAPLPTSPLGEALERARTLLARAAPQLDEQPVHGPAEVAARRALRRLLKPYSGQQRALDRALFDAITHLRLMIEQMGGAPAVLANAAETAALRDGMLRQSERISRLEIELIQRIDELSAQVERLAP